jgi:hypothetical protein
MNMTMNMNMKMYPGLQGYYNPSNENFEYKFINYFDYSVFAKYGNSNLLRHGSSHGSSNGIPSLWIIPTTLRSFPSVPYK